MSAAISNKSLSLRQRQIKNLIASLETAHDSAETQQRELPDQAIVIPTESVSIFDRIASAGLRALTGIALSQQQRIMQLQQRIAEWNQWGDRMESDYARLLEMYNDAESRAELYGDQNANLMRTIDGLRAENSALRTGLGTLHSAGLITQLEMGIGTGTGTGKLIPVTKSGTLMTRGGKVIDPSLIVPVSAETPAVESVPAVPASPVPAETPLFSAASPSPVPAAESADRALLLSLETLATVESDLCALLKIDKLSSAMEDRAVGLITKWRKAGKVVTPDQYVMWLGSALRQLK